jgi:MFS superfamily sulfate permease-like transporter
VHPDEYALLWRMRKTEFVLSIVCFLGVAFLGVIQGIFIAVGLALGNFIWRAWRPYDAVLGKVDGLKGYHDLTRYPTARRVPGLVLFRWDAPLFFANAEVFGQDVREAVAASPTPARRVVVAAEPVTDVDTTALMCSRACTTTWTPPVSSCTSPRSKTPSRTGSDAMGSWSSSGPSASTRPSGPPWTPTSPTAASNGVRRTRAER